MIDRIKILCSNESYTDLFRHLYQMHAHKERSLGTPPKAVKGFEIIPIFADDSTEIPFKELNNVNKST